MPLDDGQGAVASRTYLSVTPIHRGDGFNDIVAVFHILRAHDLL